MKTPIALFCFALFFSARAEAVCQIASDFATDTDGWTHTGASVFQWQATGGNPAGFLYVDNSEGPLTIIFAPAKFRGDLRECDGGTISFDGNLLGNGGSGYTNPNGDYGVLTITGPGSATARRDLVPGTAPNNTAPFQAWGHFEVPFTAATFGKTQTQWLAILANVSSLQMSVEALFGAEVEGIDNVRISGPASVPALPGVAPFVLGAGLLVVVAAGIARGRSVRTALSDLAGSLGSR